MMLRRKMALQTTALIVSLALICGASLWGMRVMSMQSDVTLAGAEEFRVIYEIGQRVDRAATLLNLTPAQEGAADSQVRAAIAQFEDYSASEVSSDGKARDPEIGERVHLGLSDALGPLKAGFVDLPVAVDEKKAALQTALGKISEVITSLRRDIDERNLEADQKRVRTIVTMAILSGVALMAGLVVGFLLYRSVMNPLEALGRGVRNVAAGRFTERLAASGSDEFAVLAGEFNLMAGELDTLYGTLERQVAQKSRELVRSERLASVGFLAAGVAHEINNPLGIMTGYAELSLKQLEKSSDGSAAALEAAKTLKIVCEEAFRCKKIIEKLLTLARPGAEGRGRMSLGEAAGAVVELVAGLEDYKDRTLVLDVKDGGVKGALDVVASEGEMKQVILNLTLNGLEAVAAGGRVEIVVWREGRTVRLEVGDDGRGMSRETVERVFEPFFTEKRGARSPGTGLGLSITHAIVENHGGTIKASSAGVGKGSRFVVELAAAGDMT